MDEALSASPVGHLIQHEIVDPVLLSSLLEMGIPEVRAKKALVATLNTSTDAALTWAFDHANDEGIDDPPAVRALAAVLAGVEEEYKMTFVVRQDLGMSQGKLAAQCCHGCLGLYKILLSDRDRGINQWERDGETKVVLQVKDLEGLNALQDAAAQHEVATYLVQDAGRTEIAAGSSTVLAVFGTKGAVDSVTGHLRLLK